MKQRKPHVPPSKLPDVRVGQIWRRKNPIGKKTHIVVMAVGPELCFNSPTGNQLARVRSFDLDSAQAIGTTTYPNVANFEKHYEFLGRRKPWVGDVLSLRVGTEDEKKVMYLVNGLLKEEHSLRAVYLVVYFPELQRKSAVTLYIPWGRHFWDVYTLMETLPPDKYQSITL